MTADHKRAFPALPDHIQKIHIIGICGTAMGSLAAMLKERGFDVRGSDATAYPPMSTWLEDRGIDIMMGYSAANLDWNPDVVIVGNVVRSSYEDAVEMRRRELPFLSLPEALQYFFMSQGKNLVITGTHGKTTTTGMLTWVFIHAGRQPSFMVGGITGNTGSNYQLGDGDCFIVEGDEYDTAYFDKVPKFWHYAPFRATINNLEFDHADIYPDISAIEHVFEAFVELIPEAGSLWVNGDDERAMRVSEGCKGERKTFGMGPHNSLRAEHMRQHSTYLSAEVTLDGASLGEFTLPAFGEFNLRNMLGALGIALDEGIDVEVCREAFATFKRVKKRQELVGEVDDVLVFDDFAHHPTAVGTTINALKLSYPDRRLIAIFEAKSNTSRRRIFQDAYPEAFANADHVILSKPWKKDTLPPDELLDIDQLRADIEAKGPPTELIEKVDDIAQRIAEIARPNDVIVGLSGSSFGGLHQKIIQALVARCT